MTLYPRVTYSTYKETCIHVYQMYVLRYIYLGVCYIYIQSDQTASHENLRSRCHRLKILSLSLCPQLFINCIWRIE